MTASSQRPVWGADCPISMPLPLAEPIQVDMFGFGVTQYRLGHSITSSEYEQLRVPVYAPLPPSTPVAYDDAEIDAAS
jgi:hypothetical protein